MDERLLEDGFDDISGQTTLEGTSGNMNDAQQEHVDVYESFLWMTLEL